MLDPGPGLGPRADSDNMLKMSGNAHAQRHIEVENLLFWNTDGDKSISV